MEKANVVPLHKKGDKQIRKNYLPISLFPIAGKIFEGLLYDRMFEFFIENNLISKNQSGFRPGDSCINQLLSLTHQIYQSFLGKDLGQKFSDMACTFLYFLYCLFPYC